MLLFCSLNAFLKFSNISLSSKIYIHLQGQGAPNNFYGPSEYNHKAWEQNVK